MTFQYVNACDVLFHCCFQYISDGGSSVMMKLYEQVIAKRKVSQVCVAEFSVNTAPVYLCIAAVSLLTL